MIGLFLDASAVVKRYHAERGTGPLDRLLSSGRGPVYLSYLTVVETQSAFATKVRSGMVSPESFGLLCRKLLGDVAGQVYTLAAVTSAHYKEAGRLVRDHGIAAGLRASDALQLAVAIDLHRLNLIDTVVAADQRLCAVGRLEGLSVVNLLELGGDD